MKNWTSDSEDKDVNMEEYVDKMVTIRNELFKSAKEKIVKSQLQQKEDYDRKHGRKKVCMLALGMFIAKIVGCYRS